MFMTKVHDQDAECCYFNITDRISFPDSLDSISTD